MGRNNKANIDLLKAARDEYDECNPGGTLAGRTPSRPISRTSAASSTLIDPNCAAREILTAVRMSPSVDQPAQPTTPLIDQFTTFTEDLDHCPSDDGRNLGHGDTCKPRTDTNKYEAIDEGCDIGVMETAGDYSVRLSQIEFNYEPLEEPLIPPTNMYNGPDPYLRRGVYKKN